MARTVGALLLLLIGPGLAAPVLQSTSGSLGKSTFAMSHPYAWKAFMEQFFPTKVNIAYPNSTDECNEWAKLCIDDGVVPFTCQGPHSGGSQLHAVGAYLRDSGNMSMVELERSFTAGLGGMAKYDPFMALHTGFWTPDLDHYLAALKVAGVPYFGSSFEDSAGNTLYTATLQTPGSLDATAGSFLLIQLISNSSSILAGQKGLHKHPVPQLAADTIKHAQAATPASSSSVPGRPPLKLVKVSWPSSSLSRDKGFFEEVLMGTELYSQSSSGLSIYSGKFFSADQVEVQFVEHSQQSQGQLSVAAWEQYQTSLHKECIVGPTQGFDRLADNHIGHSMPGVDCAPYKTAVEKYGLPYRFYGQAALPFFYVYWPNGWGSQLICSCSDCPSGGGYGFCTQGVKGYCSTTAPPPPPVCENKCDTTGECGANCSALVKQYSCASSYCDTCPWAGWCDMECGSGACK